MSEMSDFNARIIDEFRANQGVVGGPFEGGTLLLLHHTGAKSGADYVTPLMYRQDGDRYLIFASKGGAPANPDWYHNLKAHPEVSIEVGTETFSATADEVTGDERDRLYSAQAQDRPQFAEYAKTAGERKIPVIALTPAG
jgi:deazaflavin-dependent oxidoreductase (nitroreductase family)